jgi:hypothetical protein
MPMIYVKPSPGGRIRMPERNFMPMDAKGAWVSRVDYYERLLIGGDVIECDPPPVEPAAAPAPEPAPAAPATDPETPAA